MNIVRKLTLFSSAMIAVLLVNAEIVGTGFFSVDCEGTIRASFVETGTASDSSQSSRGIEDVKMSISMVGSPDLGVSMLSSDESGNIEFTNVCSGIYRVEVGAESIPEHLEFGGVVETLSGTQIWGNEDRLLPLELHMAGVRSPETIVDFALEYTFLRDGCDSPTTECNNSRPSFAHQSHPNERR